jgi:hypothetical protein
MFTPVVLMTEPVAGAGPALERTLGLVEDCEASFVLYKTEFYLVVKQ